MNMNKTIMSGGYLYIYSPSHPKAKGKMYIAEHILLMEAQLGRFLDEGEVVHHIDFDKSNNKIDNLQLMTKSEHSKYHSSLIPAKTIDLVCSTCGKTMTRLLAKINYKLNKGYKNFYCNRSCMGVSQGKINGKKSKPKI